MKNVLVVMSSLTGEMEPETRESVHNLRRAGAGFLLQAGVPDVALARCEALSCACAALHGEAADRDVVLMVDADIVISVEAAEAVVAQARIRKCATAAAYATKAGALAAAQWEEIPGRWLVGLGCIAIPKQMLLDLEDRSERFEIQGKIYSAFTWCGPRGGAWVAEDYRLSMRLGGVELLPIAVGHVKKTILLPSEETLRRIKQT